MPPSHRNKIFISYSHKDGRLFEEFMTMLAPAIRAGIVDLWNDTMIPTTARWREEIEAALRAAKVAVLLVSPHFLASDFIARHELPRLLERAQDKDLTVFWVCLSPCLYELTEIEAYQAAHDVSKPLCQIRKPYRQAVLCEICAKLIRLAVAPLPGRSDSSREQTVDRVNIAPSRLPRGAQNLLGREDDLARIDQAWEDPKTHILVMVAWGGVGKTSLVAEWVARKARDGWPGCKRVFDWSFYYQGTSQHSAASADAFIAAALEFFGDDALARSAASPWDKGARLADLVSRQRALLVLDGLEPLQDPGPHGGRLQERRGAMAALLPGLAANNQGLCIITTRKGVADLDSWMGKTVAYLGEREQKEDKYPQLAELSTAAGVELMKTLGVRGTDAEFQKLVKEVRGHALTLNLLGRYLAKAHGGDLRRRDRVPFEKADAAIQGGHAFKTMAAYERWLGETGEDGARQLAVLRLLGLFDRPAQVGCLAALRVESAIPDLTEPLVGLDQTGWSLTLEALAECRLISLIKETSITGFHISSVDCHPLIREHFASQLKGTNPKAWQAAHRRLYEYLRNSTPDRPQPTLDDLQPLYQAVHHGCQASMCQDALDVYRNRIQKEAQARPFKVNELRRTGMSGASATKRRISPVKYDAFYATYRLGAFGANLAAMAGFFAKPFTGSSLMRRWDDRVYILKNTGFFLRALGRVEEALDFLKGHWDDLLPKREVEVGEKASFGGIYAHTLKQIGNLHEAERVARRSVEFADQSEDIHQRVHQLALLGDILHSMGETKEARRVFAKAEDAQGKTGSQLSGPDGFRYWTLLLTLGEYEQVKQCTERILSAKSANGLNRNAALLPEHEALALCCLGQAEILRTSPPSDQDLKSADKHLERANDLMRDFSGEDLKPFCLLALGVCYALRKRSELAKERLNDAWQIAERGPMRLHMADILLLRARLFYRKKRYPWTSPQDDLVAARELIAQCGYGRRKAELAEAEEAAKHWR